MSSYQLKMNISQHIQGFKWTQYRIKGLTEDDAEQQQDKAKAKKQ